MRKRFHVTVRSVDSLNMLRTFSGTMGSGRVMSASAALAAFLGGYSRSWTRSMVASEHLMDGQASILRWFG